MTTYLVHAYCGRVLVRTTRCTSWFAATHRQRYEGMSGYTTELVRVPE